jgi:hypothetical protein
MVDVFALLPELPFAKRIKLARMAHDWRQGDVAYLATEWAKAQGWTIRIRAEHISFLEQGLGAKHKHKRARLAVLGLEE